MQTIMHLPLYQYMRKKLRNLCHFSHAKLNFNYDVGSQINFYMFPFNTTGLCCEVEVDETYVILQIISVYDKKTQTF